MIYEQWDNTDVSSRMSSGRTFPDALTLNGSVTSGVSSGLSSPRATLRTPACVQSSVSRNMHGLKTLQSFFEIK